MPYLVTPTSEYHLTILEMLESKMLDRWEVCKNLIEAADQTMKEGDPRCPPAIYSAVFSETQALEVAATGLSKVITGKTDRLTLDAGSYGIFVQATEVLREEAYNMTFAAEATECESDCKDCLSKCEEWRQAADSIQADLEAILCGEWEGK